MFTRACIRVCLSALRIVHTQRFILLAPRYGFVVVSACFSLSLAVLMLKTNKWKIWPLRCWPSVI